jgi:hypothetical protein
MPEKGKLSKMFGPYCRGRQISGMACGYKVCHFFKSQHKIMRLHAKNVDFLEILQLFMLDI